MKTYNQSVCDLASNDAEEKAEEDWVVREDGGKGGNCRTFYILKFIFITQLLSCN